MVVSSITNSDAIDFLSSCSALRQLFRDFRMTAASTHSNCSRGVRVDSMLRVRVGSMLRVRVDSMLRVRVGSMLRVRVGSMLRVRVDSMLRVRVDSMLSVRVDSMRRVRVDSMLIVRVDSMFRVRVDSMLRVRVDSMLRVRVLVACLECVLTACLEYVLTACLECGNQLQITGVRSGSCSQLGLSVAFVTRGVGVLFLTWARARCLISDVGELELMPKSWFRFASEFDFQSNPTKGTSIELEAKQDDCAAWTGHRRLS
jgi:hypothetical protein